MKTAAAIVTEPRRTHLPRRDRRPRARRAGRGRRGRRDREAARPARRSRSPAPKARSARSMRASLPFEVDADRGQRHRRGRARRSWSISAIPTSPSRPPCCPTTASAWRAWSSSSASTSASIRWRWPSRNESPRDRDARAIARLTRNYARPADFFVEKLAEGVGTIAAAFYPKPVIVRLSDFKTNEYASLLGGAGSSPRKTNPMLGFRGASRYAHPAYAAGFALECAALKRVREDMGLTNLRIMVPFCRRVEEARQRDRGHGARTASSAARTGSRST